MKGGGGEPSNLVSNWITIGSFNSDLSKNNDACVLVIYVRGTGNFVTSRIGFTQNILLHPV
jgi:fibronectin type 3 domain-containing protein